MAGDIQVEDDLDFFAIADEPGQVFRAEIAVTDYELRVSRVGEPK